MSTERLSEADMLSTLPCKALFEIFSYLCPIGDGLALISTSKRLHEKLIVQLYKEAGRCRGKKDSDNSFKFCQALDRVIGDDQGEVRKLLTSNRASDTQERLHRAKPDSSIKMREARWLVFDVRTPDKEGAWRPVLYRREVHQPDVYQHEPYRRSTHLVWYGPKVQPCLVFPRLLDILKDHCESNLPYHNVDSDFAVWISRFWLDMLLSSTDPVPVFESGFFESTLLRDGKCHSYKGRNDINDKASLIGNMMHYLTSPEFARHFSPSIFRLLLDSGADVSLIASAYISIFENIFSSRRHGVDYIPTFRFYPLILLALIDSGASIDKVEAFRLDSLLPLLNSACCDELPGPLSKALDDMADCGAGPEEMVFAFSPLAQDLLRCRRESLSSMPLLEDLVARLSA